MNKNLFFYYVLFALLPLSFSSWADRSMNLYVGQVRPVKVGKVARVAVGRDSILQTIVLDDGKILFIPIGPGETEVKIWLESGKSVSYKFNILAANMASRKVIAQSLLRTFPSLKVKAVDKYIIVEGKISPIDQKVYQSVINKIGNVVSLVNPNKFNEYQIRKLMMSFGVEAIQIGKAGKRFVIKGEIDELALKVFEGVISKIPNVSSLVKPKLFENKRMVRLKVHVAEIDSQFSRQMGIKWQKDAAGPIFSLTSPLVTNDVFGVVPNAAANNGVDFAQILSGGPNAILADLRLATNITSKLNFLESNGKARTLSRPEIMTRSGSDAKIDVGGSIPVGTTDENGRPRIDYVPYGVIVEMTPLINKKNEIVLSIKTDVKAIDTTATASGAPGFKHSKTETTINAYSGQTIAIAGLLDVSTGKSVDKVPFLGDIPFLGNLFKTKAKDFSRKELIVLVTPELVVPANENNASLGLREEIQRLERLTVPLDRGVRGSGFYTDILE